MTKPTDEERRAIAAKLRELADANRGLLGIERVQNVLYESQGILGTRGLESVAHVIERHADLIEPEPERTCRNVYDGREFECSVCGMQWHLLDREDGLEEWAHVRKPRYCPECGAKVVDE